MTTVHDELSEVVDLADIAVRAASQLRLLKNGRQLEDTDCLRQGIEFLERARKGGAFMSGKSAHLRGTLRPLNWAADTYVKLRIGSRREPNYREVAAYLSKLSRSLKTLTRRASAADPRSLDRAVRFFEALGNLLGSTADQKLRREWSTASLDA